MFSILGTRKSINKSFVLGWTVISSGHFFFKMGEFYWTFLSNSRRHFWSTKILQLVWFFVEIFGVTSSGHFFNVTTFDVKPLLGSLQTVQCQVVCYLITVFVGLGYEGNTCLIILWLLSLLIKKCRQKNHQIYPWEFTQKISTKILPKRGILVNKNVPENSWKVSMRIHPFCPRKFAFYVH